MPAGVLCLGIAVGFCSRFCRWRYFWRIIVTGLLSIVLAVVPMAVGVAMGHPLQGSLYWALGVMSGEDDEEEETAQSETIITDKNGNESGERMVFGGNTVLWRSGVCTGKDTGINQTEK